MPKQSKVVLPKSIITRTKDWALSARYFQGDSTVGFQRVLRSMREDVERTIAVVLIARQYDKLRATSVGLVLNAGGNSHSANDFIFWVARPLNAVGLKFEPTIHIFSENELHEFATPQPDEVCTFRDGLSYPRTRPLFFEKQA